MLQPARFNQQGDLVPFLFPRLLISQALVRQSREAKTGVANADALSVVGEHLGGDIDQRSGLGVNELPRPFPPVDQNQSMNVGSVAMA
jgi:hypothetical protein